MTDEASATKMSMPDQNRVFLLGSVHLYGSLCFFVFGAIYWFYVDSFYMLISNVVFGLLCGANWGLYRKFGGHRLFANIFLIVVYVGLVNVVVHLGEHDSPLIFWGLSVLSAAAFVLNNLDIAVWTTASLVFYPLCLWLKRAIVPDRAIPLDAFQTALLHSATYVGLALFLGYTYILFKSKLDRTLDQLSEKADVLAVSHAELEGMVEERTRDLTEANASLRQEADVRQRAEKERESIREQLLHSQKLEAVGQLAGGVAHDFNNLMQVILASATIIDTRQDLAGTDSARFLSEIQSAAKRAADVTRQLLLFSRKQAVVSVPVRLEEIVRSTERLIKRSVGEAVRLDVRSSGSAHITGDPGQLEQVLINLAVNARDAMPRGGTLRIATSTVTLGKDQAKSLLLGQAGDYSVLEVSDTGCGMDDKVRQRIFEPFFTTKEVGRGSGLGLAMVLGIVQGHQGAITVSSAPDKGTVVTIFLPNTDQQEVDADLEDEHTGTYPTGSETVLLIEDEEAVFEVCRQALKQLGYTVIGTTDPTRAVKVLKEYQGRVDLLLSDVIMPDIMGPDLAEDIRREAPDIKVLFMSGYSDQELFSSSEIEVGRNLISKPFDVDTLAKHVRAILDGE